MNFFSISIFLFALLFIHLNAQNPEWVNYSTTNSPLPDNYVRAIAVDVDGNKWIGSTGGLAKFNGNNWTIYNSGNSGLPANDVRAIFIDENNIKWIGTLTGGLAKFDGTNWTVYNTSNSGLPSNGVRGITKDNDGVLWMGTWTGGLAKFDGISWTVYNTLNSGLPFNYVHAVKIDDDGNKWMGTDGGGLAKFDGTNWTVYNTSNSGLPHNYVYTLEIDQSNVKWIGTYGGGLVKFNDITWTVYNTLNSGLANNNVHYLTIDEQDNKWIGMRNEGGLAKFDGTNWTIFNTSNSDLTNNWVLSLAVDALGNKWIGTYGGGISAYKEGGILPVELSLFTARVVGKNVHLNWQTKTETNNYGFEIERKVVSSQSCISVFEKIGFVEGNGNSNSPKDYSYTDNNISLGDYLYRLKQIDNDGQFEYSEIISVTNNTISDFNLEQNFPNPFNPTTTIRFSIPFTTYLNLSVYNNLGEKVMDIINGNIESGYHEIKFDASLLASGIYFYKLKTPQSSITKKMMITK